MAIRRRDLITHAAVSSTLSLTAETMACMGTYKCMSIILENIILSVLLCLESADGNCQS